MNPRPTYHDDRIDTGSAAYRAGQAQARESVALRIEAERDSICGDQIGGAAPMIRAALNSAANLARTDR